jgi:D-aminopeptidase
MRVGGLDRPETDCMILNFSTGIRMEENPGPDWIHEIPMMKESEVSTLASAAVEAAEESVINALFSARPGRGRTGNNIPAIPITKTVRSILKAKKRAR